MSLCEQVLSLNVRGLRDSKKRQQLFRWLKKHNKGSNSIVFLQETHSDESDVVEWENEWSSKIIMSHGTRNSRGVAILLPIDFNFTITETYASDDGRKIILVIKKEDTEFCLINIYSPTQNLENEQLEFFNNLERNIIEHIDKKILIGGDFNLTLNEIDRYGDNFKVTPSITKIKTMMDTYDLIDIFRINNPETKRYTWRRNRPLTQSRLDMWLIGSDVIYDVDDTDIKPSIRTDHSLITLKFAKKESNEFRGRGLWKFNSNLLSDIVYVEYMRGIINMLKAKFRNISDDSLKWELVKFKIRSATISYSKTQANLRKEFEKDLNRNLNDIATKLDENYCEDLYNESVEMKNQLESINAIKAEGYRIRSKAQHIEHNEKGSKYFIAMEKRNAKINNISRLISDNGDSITSQNNILKELHKFYQSLYSNSQYDKTLEHSFFTNNIPKLSDENKRLCENNITIQECEMAIYKMKKDKSPGTDGFTVEFYQYFWNELKELVYNSLIAAYNSNELSYEQKRGIIKLIPKKGKNLCYIKNWRPISLLNTDYKVLTNVLSHRMQVVLPSIISMDQSAYIKTRNICVNIRSIYDVIGHTLKEKNSSLIAFLDFEKAFDKLNWNFLDKTLHKTGFGESFRKWIKIIYTDAESCIINNGVTSTYFKINNGVRQGCPLSALLFILAVEVLAVAIRSDPKINGVKIGDKTFKISQLADDTTLFLKDIDSLKYVLSILKNFEKLSSLKLNMTKTEIMQIGEKMNTDYSLFGLKWEKEKVYALGSWFYEDINLSIKHTFEQKLEIIENILNQWSRRYLTILGKITVIKTLCISRINFIISSIETPSWFKTQIRTLFQNFMWNGKPPRIKNKVLNNNLENGGLRMTDISIYIDAQLASWVNRLLRNTESIPYKYISSLLHMKLNDFVKCNYDTNNFPNNFPKFYKDIFTAWFNLKEMPKTKEDILREVIWQNKFIKVENKSVFIKPFYEKGLLYINDIVENNGEFITYEKLVRKYGKYISYYEYLCLKHSIPLKWGRLLKQQGTVNVHPEREEVYITAGSESKPSYCFTSNKIYWILNNKQNITPSCEKTWFEKYYVEFSKSKWKYYFTLAKHTTCNTKIIEFQFKILHRVYASNSYVSNFDNSVKKICQLCNIEDNIVHLFVDCKRVKQFWLEFKTFLTACLDNTISLTTIEIIFGKFGLKYTAVNFCILYAKWYIHLNKDKDLISFQSFKSYLRNIFIIEKQIYTNKNKNETFSRLYSSYVRWLN